MIITAGSTNRSLYVYFVDDDGGTAPGEPTTGLLFSDIETGGSASYMRQGAARSDFTLVTLASASAAHSDGGFILVDDTNMPGIYRVDVPDAAFASGVDFVVIQLVAASGNNTVMRPLLVDLTIDLRDTVRAGLTALPNAAADAAGGLPISDAGGLDLDTILDVAVSTRLAPTTAARTLDVAATGEAGVDFSNVNGTLDAAEIGSNAITADKIAASALDGKGDWNIGKTGYSLAATGLDAIAATATGMVEIAKAVWDRVLTGATHNIANSAGRRLRQIEAAFVLHAGTAQAGSSNTITLDTGASAIDDFYNHARVVIAENTGAEQERIIVDYVGSTKVATVSPPWMTNPDATSVFEVEPGIVHAETNSKTAHVGLAQAGSASTITLSSTASATDDFYNNDVVMIDSGTGEGQERIITDYDGTTKVATIEPNWLINPDTTSNYIVEESLCVADVFAISNGVTAADNLELDYDGTGYAKANSTIGTTTTNTDMRGTDSAALASVCTEARLAELDAANLPADVAANATPAEVNAEVLDVLTVDTFAEPSGVPAATATLEDKLSWLAALARNRITQTATTQTLRNDADSGNIATAAVSDDGTTFERAEYV